MPPRAGAEFDYVAVGHVTADVVEGRRQVGGTALYSALQAARLGLRTLIVTRGVPAEIEELVAPYAAELELQVTPAPATTTLETSGFGGGRTQRVLAWAGPIERLPAVRAAIVHLGPVARETPARLALEAAGASAEFLGLTPQGMARTWDPAGGMIHEAELDEDALPARFDAAVIAEREQAFSRALLDTSGANGAVLAITAGSGPTLVHAGAGVERVPAPRVARPIEDLGAGDVFAAAFFAELHRGRAPAQAAAWGNAAAAVRLAGRGPAAIGDAATIQALASASRSR